MASSITTLPRKSYFEEFAAARTLALAIRTVTGIAGRDVGLGNPVHIDGPALAANPLAPMYGLSLIPSGREVGCPDVEPVGMQRPIIQMLHPTECLLGDLSGLKLVRRVDFDCALADFAVATVFPEHVLHEPNNKARHGTLLRYGSWDHAKAICKSAPFLTPAMLLSCFLPHPAGLREALVLLKRPGCVVAGDLATRFGARRKIQERLHH